jgi:hypothetical protein
MTVSLNERQYKILAEKREAFESAKNTSTYTGLTPDWKRRFAVVYGELFGMNAKALNYQCGGCLLGALKQFQPLMVEFENRQAVADQSIPAPSASQADHDTMPDAQVKELEKLEQQDQEQVLALVAKVAEEQNSNSNATKESRAARLINQSRNRHRR